MARLFESHLSLTAVHSDRLPTLDSSGGIARAHHRWDSILTCDNTSVGQRAAQVRDQTSGPGKERRPRGRGGVRDKDFTGIQLIHFFDAFDNAGSSRDLARTDTQPDQRTRVGMLL